MIKQAVDYSINSAEKDLDKILQYAIDQEAEEVLLDLNQKAPAVFYKVLGSWDKVLDLSLKKLVSIKEALRALTGVESRDNVPQSGSFKIGSGDKKVVFQVTINPLTAGEKIFIDLYQADFRLLQLRQLGLSGKDSSVVEKNLCKRQGMTMVLGNFNSGRTSTLYSFLDFLNEPELNVCTIEDNIDYDLPLANQIKLDLSVGLNGEFALDSVIRQDPDIIMISDIANQGLAAKSFLAADKGHTVLASLYSSNVLTAMSFLRDLGISLHLFLQAVNMVVNQRLAQKICPHCITVAKPNTTKLKQIAKIIDFADLLKRVGDRGLLPPGVKSLKDITFYRGRGCERCEEIGLWGSIGVFEILEITAEVKELIRGGHLSKIKNEIKNQSRTYIEEDALLKAIAGIISLDEVLKINDSLQY